MRGNYNLSEELDGPKRRVLGMKDEAGLQWRSDEGS